MPKLNAEDFEALGVYDPGAPHAPQRLELLEYLVGLGATADDLVARRDALSGLASVVALRGGGALTLSEAVERSGISEEKLLRIMRAAGFAEPGPADRAIVERVADLAAGSAAAESVFGEDAVLQLVRVMGSSMARLADAIVSASWSMSNPPSETRSPLDWASPVRTPRRPPSCRRSTPRLTFCYASTSSRLSARSST